MPFTNPLVAGTTLIRSAIHSPDYVAGVSGWTINKDGSYEFGAGGTFRGDVSVSATDGSQVMIDAGGGAEIDLYPQTSPGVNVDSPGHIKANTVGSVPTVATFINIQSATIDTGGPTVTPGQLLIEGKNSDGSPNPGFFTARPLLEFNGDELLHGGLIVDDFITAGVNDTDIGAGVQGSQSSVASSTASGTEVVVLQATGFVWKAGRVYSIEMNGGCSSSVAGTRADFRLKKTISGVIQATTYGEYYRTTISVANEVYPAFGKVYVKNATGSDITTDFALTLQSSTNTVFASAAVGRPRFIFVRDEGLAADSWWANVNQVS